MISGNGIIRKLTRYISPAEIEKARFKRFNEQKINEAPHLCDDFFRTEECFERGTDVVDYGYRHYDVDDLPIHINDIKSMDLTHYAAQQRSNLEPNLPEYVTLLRNGKKFYIENLYTIAPYSQAGNLWNRALKHNRSVEETVNILDSAITNLTCNETLANRGFKLLKKQYPLEMTVKIMRDSLTKNRKGAETFVPELFDFLEKFPDLREVVVKKNAFKNEIFDNVGAQRFSEIFETCKTQEEAVELAKSCQAVHDGRLAATTDSNLVDLALEMYEKQGSWNEINSMIMRRVGTNEGKMLNVRYMMEDGIHPLNILRTLKSKS